MALQRTTTQDVETAKGNQLVVYLDANNNLRIKDSNGKSALLSDYLPASSGIASVVAGNNMTVNDADPNNPILDAVIPLVYQAVLNQSGGASPPTVEVIQNNTGFTFDFQYFSAGEYVAELLGSGDLTKRFLLSVPQNSNSTDVFLKGALFYSAKGGDSTFVSVESYGGLGGVFARADGLLENCIIQITLLPVIP